MGRQNLVLYYYRSCPYCIPVLRYLDDRGIELTLRNTLETPDAREELVGIGGKSLVPCLVIDGKPLYESDDIIDWLETQYALS